MPAKSRTELFPILCLLFSASLWGIIWYPLRLLEHNGLSGLWTTLIMYAAALAVGLFLVARHLGELTRHPLLLAGVTLSTAWCNVSFILAVLDGAVVRVLLLFYLSPLWATLLGVLFLGERLNRIAIITLALALSGALFMLWKPALGAPWPGDGADWLAISSGFAFAVANVLVRKLQDTSVAVKSAASWLGVTVLAGAWLLAGGGAPPDVERGVIIAAVALGLLGIVLMTLAVQYGVTHMPVHRSAVILLFEIVVGAVSALWLTDETIAPREWIGGGLIILAAYISTRDHLNERHAPA